LDIDFSEVGVNKNFVTLTNIEHTTKDGEIIPCICFYFTYAPKSFTVQQGGDILGDHSDMLVDLDVLVHFANTEPSEIDKIIEKDTMENRREVFTRTIYR
jgi:hypothetical protein